MSEEVWERPYLHWEAGQSWYVRDWGAMEEPATYGRQRPAIRYMVSPTVYRFEVLNEEEVEGHLCVKLLCVAYDEKALKDRPGGIRFIALYRKDLGTLVCVINNSDRGDGSSSYMDHKVREPYIETTMSRDFFPFYGGIPLMFPEWDRAEVVSRDLVTARKPDPEQEPDRRGWISGRGWNSQFLIERTDERGKFLECRFQENFQNEEDAGTDRIIIVNEFVMEWRPGEPWWRECRRYEYGKHVRRTDLIRIGDVDIEPPPPAHAGSA